MGAVVIPKAMAHAMMAGLPVQVDLYTALVPMVMHSVREINDPKHDRELTQRVDRAAWPWRRDFELRVA